MTVKEIFGARLKQRLKALHKTGLALSREIGVQSPAIYKYLAGDVFPSPDVLIQIAVSLDCSVDYLLGLVDENNGLPSNKENLTDLEREVLAIFKGQSLQEQRRLLELLRIAAR